MDDIESDRLRLKEERKKEFMQAREARIQKEVSKSDSKKVNLTPEEKTALRIKLLKLRQEVAKKLREEGKPIQFNTYQVGIYGVHSYHLCIESLLRYIDFYSTDILILFLSLIYRLYFQEKEILTEDLKQMRKEQEEKAAMEARRRRQRSAMGSISTTDDVCVEISFLIFNFFVYRKCF